MSVELLEGTRYPTGENWIQNFRVSVPLALLVYGREEEFPILARSSQDTVSAVSPLIEWVNRDGRDDFNYCQIVRVPFSLPWTAMREGVDEFLRVVELTLVHGTRDEEITSRGSPKRFCGGVLQLLGREPVEGDILRLRTLRDGLLRQWTNPGGSVESEWLAEFSLQVIPA